MLSKRICGETMLMTILVLMQPITCISMTIAGICHVILGNKHMAAINFSFAFANFIVFYGKGILK